MKYDESHIEKLLAARNLAELKVFTLGHFNLELEGEKIPDNWGRDKAIQLFQFFIISRNRTALHKEQIMDRLWEGDGSDQVFKVALHGVNKVLEPKKTGRGNSKYIQRQGSSYKLNMDKVWLDGAAMESFLEIGNQSMAENKALAILAFQQAVELYQGSFLPNRVYVDWASTERERLQILALSGYLSLAELQLQKQPNESIRLCEKALNIDQTWEEAYRIQMMAHMINGNRPQVIKTYIRCQDILDKEFGIEPLPATKQLYNTIRNT